MSSSWLNKLIQRDKNLKKTFIFSYNYKNRYLKKKNLKLSDNRNRIPKNKIKENINNKCKSSSINQKLPKKYKNTNNSGNCKLNGKNEIINGGEVVHKYGELNCSNYDKSSIELKNYNIYTEKENSDSNKFILINGKNENNFMKINLKKYLNSNKDNDKNSLDSLNKKFGLLTDKRISKLDLNELNNDIKYLKLNKYKSYSSEKKERNKKSKNIKSNYIKSPTINFFIENTNENSIPYENKTYNCKLLKKETREQFSMEKTKYRKFKDLKEEDNININYFPLIKNRIDVFKVDSNQIEHMINNEEKNKENEKKIEEILIINPNINKNEIQNNNKLSNNINLSSEIKTNEESNEKKEINLEQKKNNNSKQFTKFKEKFKKNLENDANKKNDKFKISVKIKNLALGLENNMKQSELKNQNMDKEEKIKENNNEINKEKIREKMPMIYKKKKRTKILFDDK